MRVYYKLSRVVCSGNLQDLLLTMDEEERRSKVLAGKEAVSSQLSICVSLHCTILWTEVLAVGFNRKYDKTSQILNGSIVIVILMI